LLFAAGRFGIGDSLSTKFLYFAVLARLEFSVAFLYTAPLSNLVTSLGEIASTPESCRPAHII
jgi:hypothetical protein